MVYFGRNSLNKPSVAPHAESNQRKNKQYNFIKFLVFLIHSDHDTPQDLASQEASHDPCATKDNTSIMADSPKDTSSCDIHSTYVASQLSDITDDHVEQSDKNEPIRSEDCLNDSDILFNQTTTSCDTTTRSHDFDCDTSYDHDDSLDPDYKASHDLDHNESDHKASHNLDHDESIDPNHDASHDLDHDEFLNTSEADEYNDTTHAEDDMTVEDVEVNNNDDTSDTKTFQYKFLPSNFTVKVCGGIYS